jgi:DNA recombination protein RmuC
MQEFWAFLLGGVIGGAVAWAWASQRARAAAAAELRGMEARLAAAEGSAAEVRSGLTLAREEAGKLQEALRATGAEKATAEARLAEARGALEEQRRGLEEAKGQLAETFQSLAADALRASREDFLVLADQRFRALAQQAEGELAARQTAVAGLVQPLQQSLETFQQEARALEEKRLREVSSLGQRLGDMVQAQTALQRETANLVNALRAPQVRGRWGEIALRKTAELAGMTKHCDFVEQASVSTDGGRLRPDMIVRLPGKREIVVDAKVALNAYLEGLEAPTPEQREAMLVRHAQQVRAHVKRLASKEYWSQFPQAPDFVVLFIPGEVFFAAAAERDPDLLQDALANQVLIATPTTFIGLLLTAAYGWRQEQLAENADKVSKIGQELHERIVVFVEHLARVGKALKTSVDAYNGAIGSFEARVLPAARRLGELAASGNKEILAPEPVDQAPRALSGPSDS